MKKLSGLLILLVVAECVGLLLAQLFFGLFEKTVPPAVLTSFNRGSAHAAFIAYGLGAGLVIFALSAVAAGSARFFKGEK